MNDHKGHILFLNRSFWPDLEATGQFFTELSIELAKNYRVTVLAGRSYYKAVAPFKTAAFYNYESFKGLEIIRIRNTLFWKKNLLGRLMNWLTYTVISLSVLLKENPELIIAGTDPPFLGIVANFIRRLKNIPYIYYCNDLYPDVSIALGKIKGSNLFSRCFDYLNRKALSGASLVVCPGQSMKNRIRAKGIREEDILVIPFWVDIERIKPITRDKNYLIKEYGLEDKFILMYSGNFGFLQDFSGILQALAKIKDISRLAIVFIGEGARKEELKTEVASRGIKSTIFLSYQPLELLSFSLGMADLHLVPLKKGAAGTVVPSKVYGIMAVARAYLAVTDKESEPAIFAREFGCGLWADPLDFDAIAAHISWAMSAPQELENMGKAGRQFIEADFNQAKVMGEWLKIIEKCRRAKLA